MKGPGFILVLTILMAGCLVGPKVKKTRPVSSEAYRFANPGATDSITTIKWSEVYNDPVLQSLINDALKENKDLLMAVSRIDQARASLGYTKADVLPSIGYAAGASKFNNNNSAANEQGVVQRNLYYGFGTVSWEIDFWGKMRHANRAAAGELIASEESRNAIITSLVAQVATYYFQLRSLDQRLEIAHRTKKVREDATKLITERFQGGDVSEQDRFQAVAQEAIASALIPAFERQIAQTENALSILIGKNPGAIERGLENAAQQFPASIPEGLPSQLLSRRPDVRHAEQLWIAQNERIGVAQAMRFPSISLTGALGVASSELNNVTAGGSGIWHLAAGVTGPIFNFNKNKRRVEIERARTDQTRLQYEKASLVAFAEVEDALIAVRTYRLEYEARLRQVEATDGATRLSREVYESGYSAYLEVLVNEQNLLNAELQAAEALELQLRSTVLLFKALGGGWN